jgi:putative tricarboxylic transport membrane protein
MQEASGHRPDRVALIIAALLMLLAVVILFDMNRIEVASTYGMGPKAMLAVIAGGLALLAVGNGVMAFTTGLPKREEADPKAILLILGGLAALIALIGLGGGFIPATAILFAMTATAFGRRAFLIDLLIGFALGAAAYLLFDKLLSLSLPAGPLERLL